MKKLVFILLSVFFLSILTSCAYKGYSGDHLDLYTVAINSVLWLNGHSWGADFECDPQIEIIDEDIYGRKMFTYYEKYYSGADISFSALIICQDLNEKEVFYYEDINYIVKEQVIYAQNLKEFDDEEIEQLKLINDWNKEINHDKCIKKELTKSKLDIPNEKEIEKEIIYNFDLVKGQYSLFMDFLTSDSDNSNYIIYGYIQKNDGEDIYFVGLIETQKDVFKKLNIIVPSNVYDYKTEFIEFKEMNNWK
ncbi:MAG: hypothetical protein NC182_05790 [Prevotella sp.]|nr:hypothetical protein [Staphylococcus sp.]MCM1350696.1 hypothetical protein [Prevotella sp.]